ncbi:MAG: DnaJ domain-containing protein [Pseudomonadota bacterium]
MIWKSIGPIVLLQLLVAFFYLAWPMIQRVLEAVAKLIAPYLPPPQTEDGPTEESKKPFRGKWREAQYTREQAQRQTYEDAQDAKPNHRASGPRDAYLRTLGLSADVSGAQMKRAYRKLAKRYHPDRFAAVHHSDDERAVAAAKMRALNEAYDWLVANPQ